MSIARIAAILCMIALVSVFGVDSVGAEANDFKRFAEFKAHIENDVFAGDDRYYTHATRFDLTYTQDVHPFLTDWIVNQWASEADATITTLFFAQYMYTASDIEIAEPSPDDRPYAGWLYAGAALSLINDNRLDRYSVSLGVVGPSSLADTTQKRFHKWIDSAEPLGWSAQLRDEPAIDVMYERLYRPCGSSSPGLGIDYIPYFGGNLGNVFIQGRVGVTFRLGMNLPDDFGPSPIRPSAALLSLEPERTHPLRWYVFASCEGRLVGRNIFLDGNTYRSSASVDKKPLVGDLILGASVVFYDNLTITYSYVRRSKEFDTQEFSQEFGSLSIACRF